MRCYFVACLLVVFLLHFPSLIQSRMKFLTILALSISILTASAAMERPSFHTKGTPTGKPSGTLKPGEYWWHPEISPEGPLMILISIPEQRMHVYQRHSDRSLHREHWFQRSQYTRRRIHDFGEAA